MNAFWERIRRRQPRWLHIEVRLAESRELRFLLPLEPFETPLAFALALAGWWAQRRAGFRGGWRMLFDPPRLGLDQLHPDEPLVEIKDAHNYFLLKIGGLL